ncbi:MAG: type II toxin-antitoxin system HicB family antitoxin [Candidatus Micrarchaeota archaeon]|nr:type II toxin-antitoxin system HicB family antitoxin [Candidatus Micrarchaeota archaeon]
MGDMMKGKYTIIITKGKFAFVAYCEELGIASQGRTVKEAKKNVSEAIDLYLEEARDSKVAKSNLPIVTTISIG